MDNFCFNHNFVHNFSTFLLCKITNLDIFLRTYMFVTRNIGINNYCDQLRGGNRFRWLKKSIFFCHKLLVKLSKNMFRKFQWKILIRSGVTIVFKWMSPLECRTARYYSYFMHFSRNDFFGTSVHCSSKSFRSIILIISRYFLYIITLYLNLNP